MGYIYNLKRSLPDHRDFVALPPGRWVRLPKHVRFGDTIAVRDQGQQGSCTGHAWRTARMALGIAEELSPAFVYYEERLMENTADTDGGASLRDGAEVLLKQGICDERLDPYDAATYTTAPSDLAKQDAQTKVVGSYAQVRDLVSVRHRLASRFPVVLGITVHPSFEHTPATGLVPLPTKGEAVLGAHALCALGYDDYHRHLIFQNSWGVSWGDKGYGYLPYDYWLNADWCFESWTITGKVA